MDTYKHFVRARHAAYLARLQGRPYQGDPIVQAFRFTNVFRIADYGSQFYVRELMGEEPLWRAYLYRYTNRPEPWEAFAAEYGRFPLPEDVRSGALLDVWRDIPVFGTAYLIHYPGLKATGLSQLEWYLQTSLRVKDLEPDWATATPPERIALLKTLPRTGDFMAMQILTDYGYTGDDCEDDYILPGPGAIAGAAALRRKDTEALIYELRDYWRSEGDVLLDGLPPSLMDVQNTLCEYQKYHRYWTQGKRGRTYTVRHPELPPLIIPEGWRNR